MLRREFGIHPPQTGKANMETTLFNKRLPKMSLYNTCLLSYIERDDEKKSNRSELAEVLPSLMIAARRSSQRSHRLEYLDYPSDLHPLIHFGYCYSKLYIIYISHRLEYLDFPSLQPALHLFCWDLIHTHFYIIKIIDIPRSEELIGKRKQIFLNSSL